MKFFTLPDSSRTFQDGLTAGTNVGAIGFDEVAQWAYLDRLLIVAEINSWNACDFWQSSPLVQARVLE